ncbi:MAG: diacylglycerol kinase family lipid kinase [Carnobacterium sp.]|uniref:diacylglycerol/lipid kinase family protein n=1 Tax=Carnobacterium sp. TaxID=48221 RepID=UPI002FC9330A
MTNQKHFHIIVNELAGSGNGKLICTTLVKLLTEKKLTFQLHKTQYAGHAIQLTTELAKKIVTASEINAPLLMIVGGDGTLHEAVQGLGEEYKDMPLAYIPAGSGNDFAKGLGISKKTHEALSQILQATSPKKIDVLRYQEKILQQEGYAINNIGIGFDAATVKYTNQSSTKVRLNKYKLGSFAYLASVATVLFKQKGFPIEVIADGKQQFFPKAFLVTVNNHPYFGGGIGISPKASPYDQQVDLIILQKSSVFKIIWLFLLMLNGGRHLQHKDVHSFQARHIQIRSTQLEDTQADGEFLGHRSVHFYFSATTRYFWF